MKVGAHQEKEKNEKIGKREKGRPISKRLRAAILRSFRGQHGEKNGLFEESAPGGCGA